MYDYSPQNSSYRNPRTIDYVRCVPVVVPVVLILGFITRAVLAFN